MSNKRIPKGKWTGVTKQDLPPDLEGGPSSKSETEEQQPDSVDRENPMISFDVLPFAAPSPE